MQRNLVSGARILLVESDAPFRRSLANCMKRAGYGFDSCATADEARQLARSRRYDLCVVAYHLRDGNGARLVAELKRMHGTLRAVLISFYDFEWISRDVTPVADGFLKKPFDLLDFERMMHSMVATVPTPALFSSLASSVEQGPVPVLKERAL